YGKFHNKTEIVKILDILKDCGVTGLVVDVKPSTGYTMKKSTNTKEFTTKNGKTKPADYVDFVIAEAKKRNMKVYLSIVTFVDGNNYGSNGFAADNPDFKEKYESIIVKNAQGQLGRASEKGNTFMNPAQPAVQNRVLDIIKEIVGKFPLDGLILDYGRYTDINADFSDFSKQQFIEFMKTKYNDSQAANMIFTTVIVSTCNDNNGQIVPNSTGRYYKPWLVYR